MDDFYKKNWSLIEEFLGYIKTLPEFPTVKFLILYGSMADETADACSDIDVALSCDLPGVEAERFRMFLMGRVPDTFDIHIFEHLPLYIRIEVLKGKVLFVKDEDELYDTAYRTIREYDLFKPHYLDYIGEKAL